MGRAFGRDGWGAIRTTEELALILPVPLFRIAVGTARPRFPTTDVPASSSIVTIVGTSGRGPTANGWLARLPLGINGQQWQDVAVPVLQDERITSWRGVLRVGGSPITLSQDVIGPYGTVATTSSGIPLTAGTVIGTSTPTSSSVGNLFPRDEVEFLRLLADLVRERGALVGYGA